VTFVSRYVAIELDPKRLLDGAHLVARPLLADGIVVDDRLPFALHFEYDGRKVGRLRRQPGQAQGEFILHEGYVLAALQQTDGFYFRFQAANGNQSAAGEFDGQ